MAIERYVMQADPMDSVAELVAMGFQHEDIKQRVKGEIPENVESLVDELRVIKKQLDMFAEREKEIKKALLMAMQSAGEDKWSNDLIEISRRAGYERITLDGEKLKKSYPEAYNECQKVSKVSESLTYKIL